MPERNPQQDGVQDHKVPHRHYPFDNSIRLIVVSHNSPFSRKTNHAVFLFKETFLPIFFF
jgi:hypothetical protein